jgi:hypothetical protein
MQPCTPSASVIFRAISSDTKSSSLTLAPKSRTQRQELVSLLGSPLQKTSFLEVAIAMVPSPGLRLVSLNGAEVIQDPSRLGKCNNTSPSRLDVRIRWCVSWHSRTDLARRSYQISSLAMTCMKPTSGRSPICGRKLHRSVSRP